MALLSPSSISDYIKPSIILLLGDYIADVHHLNLLHKTFNKMNMGFERRTYTSKIIAVFRMISKSVLFCLLDSKPDAKGTAAYLYVLSKAWFGVFFMRYWHQWILINSHYTLSNNFITRNAYMCIELNAHAVH